jgi:hypothetical protein
MIDWESLSLDVREDMTKVVFGRLNELVHGGVDRVDNLMFFVEVAEIVTCDITSLRCNSISSLEVWPSKVEAGRKVDDSFFLGELDYGDCSPSLLCQLTIHCYVIELRDTYRNACRDNAMQAKKPFQAARDRMLSSFSAASKRAFTSSILT